MQTTRKQHLASTDTHLPVTGNPPHCSDSQLPITRWPRQSGVPVGVAPPTRSQLGLQRHTQVPVQALTHWLPPTHPRSLASQCMSGQPTYYDNSGGLVYSHTTPCPPAANFLRPQIYLSYSINITYKHLRVLYTHTCRLPQPAPKSSFKQPNSFFLLPFTTNIDV